MEVTYMKDDLSDHQISIKKKFRLETILCWCLSQIISFLVIFRKRGNQIILPLQKIEL